MARAILETGDLSTRAAIGMSGGTALRMSMPNDPSLATAATRRADCNRDGLLLIATHG